MEDMELTGLTEVTELTVATGTLHPLPVLLSVSVAAD